VILLVALGLVALSVPLARGDLARLAHVRLRAPGLLAAALALQLFIAFVIPRGPGGLLGAIHAASYVLGGVFLFLNLRRPGVWLLAVGAGLNFLAIVANAGVMPASAQAVRTAGLASQPGLFANSQVLADPNLSFLGDVFALPQWFPFANVFSIGDVCIILGIALFLHRASASRLRLPTVGGYGPVLRDGNFRRVWAAQATSSLGDFVYELSIAAAIATRNGATQALALLLVCYMGAAGLAGLLAGGILDRRSRRLILIVTDVVRAAAVGSLLVVGEQTMAHLAVVAGILGAGSAVFQAGVQASLPRLVSARHLVAANALISLTFNAAVMLGPILGGIAVVRLGVRPGIAINVLSFVVSAALLLRSRIHQGAPEAGVPVLRALREGLAHAMRTPLVRRVVLVMSLVMLATAIRAPLEPLLVLDELGGSPATLGLLGGCWGLGMVLGSLWAPSIAGRFRRESLLLGGVGLVSVGTLLVPATSSIGLILLLAVLAGSGNGLGSVAYESLLQERTPDHLRGRVLAAVEGFLNLAFLAGAGVVATGALGVGVRGGFLIAGSLLAGAVVLGSVRGRSRKAAAVPAVS
jgi:MFS family permease